MDEQPHRVATRVTKNMAVQIVALASTTISKLLITIMIGRLFGAEYVGEFAFVMTFNLIFNFAVTLGLPWALIREIATNPKQASRYTRTGLSLVAAAGGFSVPLSMVIVLLLGRSTPTIIAVGITSLALLFDGLAQTVSAVFNGYERMEMTSVVIIVQELAFLIVGIVVLVMRLPFLWLFAIYVPSRWIGFWVSLRLYRKLMDEPLHFGWEADVARTLLKVTWPFAANMALAPIYLRIDVLMLTLFHGNVAVGIYEAATSIFYRFNVVARTINNALMPLMAREYESQAERITAYINVATKYQMVIGMPLTVASVMLAGSLIQFLYGPGFAPSASVFALMATFITVRFIDNTLATALTASGLQAKRSLIVAAVAVFNVVANLFILPTYSFIGAAATTIATDIVFFGLLYFALARKVSHPLDFRVLIKPLVASGGMAVAIYLLREWSLLPLLLSSGFVYVILLLILKTFSRQEIQTIAHISHQALNLIKKRRNHKQLSTPV